MRTLWMVAGFAVYLVAVRAEGAPPPPRPVAPSAGLLRQLQQGLPAKARQRLAGTITPSQQLALLQSDPTLSGPLREFLRAGAKFQQAEPIWQAGLTLTPLAATWPAGSTYPDFRLSLQTQAASITPNQPLPVASQDPPLLWLWAPNNNSPLFTIEARWPARGAYLLTFFMRDVWPNTPFKPRVWQDNEPLEVYANATNGADQFSICWLAPDPANLYHAIRVYPAEAQYAFTNCCLAKVFISKIWLE